MALVILVMLTPSAVGPALSVTATALLGLVASVFRRLNSDYHLTVAEAPDGLRLRSGLFQTAAETIPRGRVQGVRMIEPWLWRPFGWCRLVVDVAGKQRAGRESRSIGEALRADPAGRLEGAGGLAARAHPAGGAAGPRPVRPGEPGGSRPFATATSHGAATVRTRSRPAAESAGSPTGCRSPRCRASGRWKARCSAGSGWPPSTSTRPGATFTPLCATGTGRSATGWSTSCPPYAGRPGRQLRLRVQREQRARLVPGRPRREIPGPRGLL